MSNGLEFDRSPDLLLPYFLWQERLIVNKYRNIFPTLQGTGEKHKTQNSVDAKKCSLSALQAIVKT